ncbi:hypothetical protein FHS29_004168 [Saccharothrix tamanrassetensis]|uniref:Uncharacterized protein n=1 Tax=Saccharothrix tamanrassetensis TaxID=1051531 RepID=A0A841CKV9_9PSEU|nr:hypothetical protein [Saccharothrix tamanrassetensis]MBB5957573.1 hypothetical protein [Saccharothrix tamanrassetensis]
MPEPVLVSIAASLATRAVAGLYELVRARFAGDPAAIAALTAAEGAPPDSPQVHALGEVLGRAAATDPRFGEELRRAHEQAGVAQTGRVTNQISGTVHGNVLQAGDIQGGVSFR